MSPPSENLLGSFTIEFDHGLLAVEDAGSAAVHDDWDPVNEYVHRDQDSLYVCGV